MTLFLQDNKIKFNQKESDQINGVLIDHFDILCFNVASITCVLATINNKTIDAKLIKNVREYIHSTCKRKKLTGGSMPSDYYGYQNSIYSPGNENMGTNTGTLDFDNGIQRASLGPQTGGRSKILYDKSMETRVKNIIDNHNLTVKKSSFINLMGIINDNLLCLKANLKDNQPITLSKIQTILKEKQFAVFN